MKKEMRLIDANALKANFVVLGEFAKDLWHAVTIRSAIDNAPTVDAVEVVRGKWMQIEFWTSGGTWRCSECGRQIMFLEGTPTTQEIHYCPNCGANMDEKMEHYGEEE